MVNAQGIAEAGAADAVDYRPGRGYQGVLSAAFFLIVLFMFNALAGAIWLATHRLPIDAVIFLLMFAGAGVLVLYCGLFLFSASHSSIALGADRVRVMLPNWRGPSPLFPYGEAEVVYADIAAVETRSEFYRYLILPVAMRSASLVKKSGERMTLGYVLSNSLDPAMPFPAIAEEIARRAGVPVVDKGVVEAGQGLRTLVQDEPAWDAPQLSPERVTELQAKADLRWKLAMGAGLVVAVMAVIFQAMRFFGA
jgi:hypothetical protein